MKLLLKILLFIFIFSPQAYADKYTIRMDCLKSTNEKECKDFSYQLSKRMAIRECDKQKLFFHESSLETRTEPKDEQQFTVVCKLTYHCLPQ